MPAIEHREEYFKSFPPCARNWTDAQRADHDEELLRLRDLGFNSREIAIRTSSKQSYCADRLAECGISERPSPKVRLPLIYKTEGQNYYSIKDPRWDGGRYLA